MASNPPRGTRVNGVMCGPHGTRWFEPLCTLNIGQTWELYSDQNQRVVKCSFGCKEVYINILKPDLAYGVYSNGDFDVVKGGSHAIPVCAGCGHLYQYSSKITCFAEYGPLITGAYGVQPIPVGHKSSNTALANNLLTKVKEQIAAKKPQRLCQCGAWATGVPDYSILHDNTRTFTCPAYRATK